MTEQRNNEPPRDDLDATFAALAAAEQQHKATPALRQSIRQNVHRGMRGGTEADQRESLWTWIAGHWWRTVSIGGTAAAIPLLAGALLGYALTGEEQSLADPASDWLSSYNTVAQSTVPGMPEAATPGDMAP